MAQMQFQPLGSFSTGRKTASVSTAFAIPIFPYGVLTGTPPNARQSKVKTGIIHVTSIWLNQATNGQTLTFMRPLNVVTFTADAAAGQKVLSISADPGLYASNKWRGGSMFSNGVASGAVADTAIAAGDYCIYQVADGTWFMDTANGSISAGTITMSTNVPVSGVKNNGLFYWFGPPGQNTDPATNLGCPQMATGFQTLGALINIADENGIFCTLYPGDPAVLYNPNITTVSIIENVTGYWAKH